MKVKISGAAAASDILLFKRRGKEVGRPNFFKIFNKLINFGYYVKEKPSVLCLTYVTVCDTISSCSFLLNSGKKRGTC